MRHKLLAISSVLTLYCVAPTPAASAFALLLSNQSFAPTGIVPAFSNVRVFDFEIELADPLVAGGVYDESSLVLAQYLVRGSLSLNPPTPSGFPGFLLNRTPSGEGTISSQDWIAQGSSLAFEVAASANLADGLQLSELVPDANGLLFELDAREFERLDRARYHPPQLRLFANGTGILRNSNNSSGSTGTTNPGTGLTVDVDFGDEYVTNLGFDPSQITLVAPEPGTAFLVGIGLTLLAVRQRSRPRRCARTGRAAPVRTIG